MKSQAIRYRNRVGVIVAAVAAGLALAPAAYALTPKPMKRNVRRQISRQRAVLSAAIDVANPQKRYDPLNRRANWLKRTGGSFLSGPGKTHWATVPVTRNGVKGQVVLRATKDKAHKLSQAEVRIKDQSTGYLTFQMTVNNAAPSVGFYQNHRPISKSAFKTAVRELAPVDRSSLSRNTRGGLDIMGMALAKEANLLGTPLDYFVQALRTR